MAGNLASTPENRHKTSSFPIRGWPELWLLHSRPCRYDSSGNQMAQANNTKSRGGITAYGDYVAGLQRLAMEPPSAADWEKRALAALNGQASAELRQLVSLKTRRRFGAFFTGSKLANKFIS
jgi:hypothetical protein